jgi:hypothetical protein
MFKKIQEDLQEINNQGDKEKAETGRMSQAFAEAGSYLISVSIWKRWSFYFYTFLFKDRNSGRDLRATYLSLKFMRRMRMICWWLQIKSAFRRLFN